MVRSVETSEVNELLNKNLRKFFHFLSPYFMLQPAHKCLEWLIRRYNIEAYNQDELASLILPYHGTRIFVRCVQIMELSGSKWDWLETVKKSGAPLAKQTLFNRLACDQYLIQQVTKGTIDMAKTLGDKAYLLQTAYAFYCTAILGCMEYAGKVTEAHFMNILPGLLKGLSSRAVDYTSAALIILGDLLSRISLAPDTLDILVNKLMSVKHPALEQETMMLLILLFQSQGDHYKAIPVAVLEQLIRSKTFLATLSELSAAHYRVSPLLVPILTVCLRRLQEKNDDFAVLKNFCEQCLSFVVFSDVDAKEVTKCVLTSYILKETVEDTVITIDSGDESDIPLSDTNLDVSMWYSSFVRAIERQYPEILSQTMKEILAVDSSILSPQRKSSLKAVLGFLLTNSAAQEDGNIDLFEGLFHRQAKCRVAAVKTLVSKFSDIQMSSERTRDLIHSTLKERLQDYDPRVVSEVLKLPTSALIEQVSEETLLKRVFEVLNKTESNWQKAKVKCLKHLLEYSQWTLITATEMFIQLFPLVQQKTSADEDLQLFEQFVKNGAMQKNWSIVQRLADKVTKAAPGVSLDIEAILAEELKKKMTIVPLADLIIYCEKPMTYKTPLQINFALKLMRMEKKKVDIMTAQRILNIVATKEYQVAAGTATEILHHLIESVHVKGKFKKIDFLDGSTQPDVKFLRSLFESLIHRLFDEETATDPQFPKMIREFYLKFIENEEEVSNFLANYFSAHKLVNNRVDLQSQMMAMCVAKALMKQRVENNEDIILSSSGMVKVVLGLHQDSPAVKKVVMRCVEILAEKGPDDWRKFCAALVKGKESILMDKDQLAFVIFNHVTTTQKGKAMNPSVKLILDVIVDPATPDYIAAQALGLIQHVNSAEIVKMLANCIDQVFNRFQSITEKRELNQHQMKIIEEIVNRLNQSTLIVTAKNPDIWDKILTQILNNGGILYRCGDDTDSPLLKLLEVMDEAMFGKLTMDYQTQFLRTCLLNCCQQSHCQAVFTHAVAKLIKSIPVNGKVLEALFDEMIINPNAVVSDGPRSRRIEPSADLLLTDNWKRGVILLEMMQNKKDVTNMQLIVPPLFKILKTCIDFDEQSPVDYVKQLVLSSLLHCCQQLQEKVSKVDGGLKVDLIVNCIRGSVNPQTHHHALQLICQLAPLAPEIVLHNITDIFTFMGSTIVRQDDAYSFQIILKIIDSVVPILIEKSEKDSSKLVAVLKTFADIILDVPEHRRQAMYVKLLTTLDQRYLWVFVAIVLSNHVLQEKPNKSKEDDLPKSIRVTLGILSEFEPVTVVETATRLMDYMQKIRLEEELEKDQEDEGRKRAKNRASGSFDESLEVAIFDAQKSTKKQQRHMKYMLIKFISNAMAAPAFVRTVNGRQQDDDEFRRIKPFYQEFIIKDLMCIAATSQINATSQYWKVIMHHCYESLNNVIVLLTNQMFFAVVEGLLKHTIWTVRKKMLELLVNKFQSLSEEQSPLTNEDQLSLTKLLKPLEQIILTIRDQSTTGSELSKSTTEMMVIQQLALIVVKLMGKLLVENYPEEMTALLRILIGLLDNRSEIPVVVLSANVLCIADLSVNVGASAIEFLPVVMPIFLEILNTQTHNTTVDTILTSILTALQKVVETFAIFLSAYLVDILVALSLLAVKLNAISERDAKVNAALAKITEMEEKVAQYNPLRILVPAVEVAYTKLIVQPKAVDAIGPLMSVLSKSISEVAPQEIYGVQEELAKFFLEALQFRATYAAGSELTLKELNTIEDQIVDTLISLTLKLSETTFRPLYYKIYDWAIRDDASEGAEKSERTITFYR